jgi:hypothetical protein
MNAWGCSPCQDVVRSAVLAPGSSLSATYFVRNCGATTDYSSIVSVHATTEAFDTTTRHVFVVRGRHDIDLKWESGGALFVRCRDCRREDVFRQIVVLGTSDVTYELRGGELQK